MKKLFSSIFLGFLCGMLCLIVIGATRMPNGLTISGYGAGDGKVWTATNAAGEGHWATPSATASGSTFHDIYVTNNASFSNATFRGADGVWHLFSDTSATYGLGADAMIWTNVGAGITTLFSINQNGIDAYVDNFNIFGDFLTTGIATFNGLTNQSYLSFLNLVMESDGSNFRITESGGGTVMDIAIGGNLVTFDIDVATEDLTADSVTTGPVIRSDAAPVSAGTNLVVGTSSDHSYTIISNASFQFVFTGTALRGEKVELTVSNYSAAAIFVTNTAGVFDFEVASNVTTWVVGSNSMRHFVFRSATNFNAGTPRWEKIGGAQKQAELAAALPFALTTNADSSIITITSAPPSSFIEIREEFWYAGATDPALAYGWTKSGGIGTIGTGGTASNHWGVIRARSTGSGRNPAGLLANEESIALGSALPFYCEWVIKLTPLSAAGRDYNLVCGLGDTITASLTQQVDSVSFRYNHAVNSGNFYAVTTANSVSTTNNCNVGPADNTWVRLGISIDAATNAVFYVDGVSKATNANSNVPGGTARVLGPLCHTVPNDSNAGDIDMFIDFFYLKAATPNR